MNMYFKSVFQALRESILQQDEYKTNPYFLRFFQSNTIVCLIIHIFCKSCEPKIVFALISILEKQFHGRKILQNL